MWKKAAIRRGGDGVLYRQCGPEKDVYHLETYKESMQKSKVQWRIPFVLEKGSWVYSLEKRTAITPRVRCMITRRRSRPSQAACRRLVRS